MHEGVIDVTRQIGGGFGFVRLKKTNRLPSHKWLEVSKIQKACGIKGEFVFFVLYGDTEHIVGHKMVVDWVIYGPQSLIALKGGLDVGDKVVIAKTDSTFKAESTYRTNIDEMRGLCCMPATISCVMQEGNRWVYNIKEDKGRNTWGITCFSKLVVCDV